MMIYGIDTEEFSDKGIKEQKEKHAKFLEELALNRKESTNNIYINQEGINRVNNLASNIYGK